MIGFEITPYDRKIWEEKLADFLPDKIIDMHMHLWARGTRKASQKGCVTWTSIVAPEMPYEDMKESYAALFPGKKITQVLTASPSCDLKTGNAYIRKCADAGGHRSLYCTNWDSDETEIAAALDAGFSGIKPYQNNSPSYIPAAEVRIFDFLTPRQLEFANKVGCVVLLHIPRALRLRDPINLAQLVEIDEKYPNAKVIVAHVGRAYIPSDVGDGMEVLKHTKNLHFDFSANCSEYAITKMLEVIDTDRIMFGTDMPFTKMRMYRIEDGGTYVNIVPRGQYNCDGDPHMRETDETDITLFAYEELLAFRASCEKLGLTKKDVNRMMYENASKMFGITL